MQISLTIISGQSIEGFSDTGLKFRAYRTGLNQWTIESYDDDIDEDWETTFVEGDFATILKAANTWFGPKLETSIISGQSIEGFSDTGLKFRAYRADDSLWYVESYDDDEDWECVMVEGDFATILKAANTWFGL